MSSWSVVNYAFTEWQDDKLVVGSVGGGRGDTSLGFRTGNIGGC